jgi:hypothetical protein
MRRLLYWAKLVGINFLVFVLLILILETLVRLTLPKIHRNSDLSLFQDYRYGSSYGLKPNTRGYSFGALIVTDHRGFRIDPSQRPQDNKKTLLLMGDSLSMGVGVSAAESFPERLNRRFKTFQVINAAVVGYNMADYLEVLAKILPEVRPEGVVVGLCLNDPEDLDDEQLAAALRKGEVTKEAYRLRYPNPLWRTIR